MRRPRPDDPNAEPTLKSLKKLLKEENEYSYTLNNMGRAYDKCLDRIALLEVMIERKIYSPFYPPRKNINTSMSKGGYGEHYAAG
jgi:hypothetical protein